MVVTRQLSQRINVSEDYANCVRTLNQDLNKGFPFSHLPHLLLPHILRQRLEIRYDFSPREPVLISDSRDVKHNYTILNLTQAKIFAVRISSLLGLQQNVNQTLFGIIPVCLHCLHSFCLQTLTRFGKIRPFSANSSQLHQRNGKKVCLI